MSYGYSVRLVDRNDEADGDMPGVRLGRLCIARRVPAVEVASRFNVSRATVYNWFCGRTQPKPELVAAISEYSDSLA
jgi:transcriptional regulator with XRE-family HTH domain